MQCLLHVCMHQNQQHLAQSVYVLQKCLLLRRKSDQNSTEHSNNGGCSVAFTKMKQNNSSSDSNQSAIISLSSFNHAVSGFESPISFFSLYTLRAQWTRRQHDNRERLRANFLVRSQYFFDSIISASNGEKKNENPDKYGFVIKCYKNNNNNKVHSTQRAKL